MIFNLFKSKPTLKELIPKGFVDIHSHVLPGIDDGAKNVEESIELINNMKEMGFSKIIGTPHTYMGLYNNTNTTIKNSYNSIVNHFDNNTIIEYASEYFLDDSIIEKSEKKTLLCLKDNYVLVETSFLSPVKNIFDIIFKLKLNDYIPIIAHPERYKYWKTKREFEKLKRMGCKFQINLFSTIGYYGVEIVKMSDFLLRNNFVDYVGSDIHKLKQISLFQQKLKIREINKLKKAIESNKEFN